jgi:23S rRNA (cytidine1920-2'-O)/16S rRNA (cytidine1409-2'-O)-methyltransferase
MLFAQVSSSVQTSFAQDSVLDVSLPPQPAASAESSSTRTTNGTASARCTRPSSHGCPGGVHDLGVPRKRLDVLLVERGLAETRAQAQALVLAGLVPGFTKPGQQVTDETELSVERPPRFVSRGGEKLARALDVLGVDPAGRDCLDIGASTGGFTDCLLQRGAARVIALDVGHGQLHPRLRADERVVVLERVNARRLESLPFAPELVTCDVSFISATRVLPPAIALASPEWQALVLVKPQFEAGRADAPKGVVRDPAVHRRVLRAFCDAAGPWGARVAGIVDSGHPGPKGNREFVVHLIASETPSDPDELERRIDATVG